MKNKDFEDEILLKKLKKEIKIAREQVKRGEYYTEEEVRLQLGL